MKALNTIVGLLAIGSLLLMSCKQVAQSVEDTFHPNPAAVSKPGRDKESGISGEYTGITKTSRTTTSTQHIQNHEVIVNGDTLHTAEVQERALVLFKELEALQQNKTGDNSREIQKKVNDFLKNAHLGQHAAPSTTPRKQHFLTLTQLEKAERKLKELPQYAGKAIQIYQSVHFDEDGSIRLMLQHPQNPKYADHYEYKNGKWSAPKPVQITGDNMARRLLPLDRISFPCAVKVLRQYNEKAIQVAGAKPGTHVYLSIWDGQMRWFPAMINGTRERYSIDFNADGTLKSFTRD